MDLVDSKYIGLISSRLQKFKKVKTGLYNFRCPICGDSQKNKNKTRGYFYQIKNNTNFKCHNCGASMSLNSFLKTMDTILYKQYTLEKFKEGHTGKNFVADEPKFVFEKPIFKSKIILPLCDEVESSRTYLQKRRIDPKKFYYAQNFKEFCNSYKKVFSETTFDEPRIIIPLYQEKSLIGFQGRSLGNSPNKYITVMLDEEAPKIYGLETIDTKLPIYVVEGPFDSTFIDNSVALCGSDGDVRCLEGSDIIFVYDNEPRNREIVKRIGQCIDRNQRVVIWPTNIIEKDINDMVLAGHNITDVLKLNTYSGLQAKVKFNNWKRI